MNYNDGHHTKFFVLFPHASMEICVFFTGITGYGLQDFKDVLTAFLALFFFCFLDFKKEFLLFTLGL